MINNCRMLSWFSTITHINIHTLIIYCWLQSTWFQFLKRCYRGLHFYEYILCYSINHIFIFVGHVNTFLANYCNWSELGLKPKPLISIGGSPKLALSQLLSEWVIEIISTEGLLMETIKSLAGLGARRETGRFSVGRGPEGVSSTSWLIP